MSKDKEKMYPVFLDLRGRGCLVVGGGAVASRKVGPLLDAGGDVTVVAPEAAERIRGRAAEGLVRWEKREYRAGEAAEYFIVVAATDIREVNERVSRDARDAGRIVNAVDMPDLCDFYVPSVVRRGELQIAISTAGACPALARKTRLDLEKRFPESYARLVGALGNFRARVIESVAGLDERKRVLERVVNSREMELFLDGDEAPLVALMSKCIS